jgi:hypothetical protein
VKIRLWGTEQECRQAAERLMGTPGLLVLSVSGPRADRGASVLVRVYLEARLEPPPTAHAGNPAGPARSRRRQALPPGGAQ